MSHLVIIDGHAIAHRAYHSIPKLDFNGQPVNALYGFYSMILSSVEILKPKYLIVTLDSPGPTFRNSEFVGYRAKRAKPDFDLISQLPLLPKTLETSGITHFSMGGYEADDLIATIARKAQSTKFIDKITVITGDKDLMQLVNDKVSLFVPIRGLSETKIFGPDQVKEKLGVTPSQVVDLKALMGDMSDNYPGVAGVGPVAATKLLADYQNLDNIYAHLSDIPATLRQKLETDRDNAYLSQKLATLIDNIPLKFKFRDSRFDSKKISGLETLFSGYNFKSLLGRLRRSHPKSAQKPKNKLKSTQTSLF